MTVTPLRFDIHQITPISLVMYIALKLVEYYAKVIQ